MQKRLGKKADILISVVQRGDQLVVGTQISSITPFKMTGEQVKRIAPKSNVSSPMFGGLFRLQMRHLSCTPWKSHFSSLNRLQRMTSRVCGCEGASEQEGGEVARTNTGHKGCQP